MTDTKEEAVPSQGKDDERSSAAGSKQNGASDLPADADKRQSQDKGSLVQKTLLEYKLPDVEALLAEASGGAKQDAAQTSESVVVHKTMMDYEVGALAANSASGANSGSDAGSSVSPSAGLDAGAPEMPPPPPPDLAHKQGSAKAQKTMLDHSVLWDTVARAAAEMEVKVAEQIKERANEPFKPFQEITRYKMATPCESVWDETNPKERFRYCGLCQLHVYDFSGLELPEAEELIFKRENRKNAPLFKRADGKFLTSDCPVAIKKKRNFVMSLVGGVIAVICVLGLLLAMPKPPQPTVTRQADQGPTDWTPDRETKTSGTTAKTATQAARSTQPSAGATQPAAPVPARDQNNNQNDDYWQYSSDPAAEVPAPAPAQQTYTPQPSYAPAQGQQQSPAAQQAPAAQAEQAGARGGSGAQPATGSGQPNSAAGVQYYGR